MFSTQKQAEQYIGHTIAKWENLQAYDNEQTILLTTVDLAQKEYGVMCGELPRGKACLSQPKVIEFLDKHCNGVLIGSISDEMPSTEILMCYIIVTNQGSYKSKNAVAKKFARIVSSEGGSLDFQGKVSTTTDQFLFESE